MRDNYSTIGGATYSLKETATPARWIDDSIIYKKTINFGNLPNNGGKSVAHGILNLKDVVSIHGIAQGGTTFLQTSMGGLNGFTLGVVGEDVSIATSNDRSSLSAYITIFYTKKL